MYYLAIDPGIDTGWALFRAGGTLVTCGLGDGWTIHAVGRALIERPQVYNPRLSKGDPNDLITLAIRVGRYVERLEACMGAQVDLVLPRDWKGQVPKDVHNARVLRGLAPECRRTFQINTRDVANLKLNNVIDAVGLGTWAFARRKWG